MDMYQAFNINNFIMKHAKNAKKKYKTNQIVKIVTQMM